MGNLVNARSPWPIRVALADRDQHQSRLRSILVGSKNRAPPASRAWDVELDRAAKPSPVVAFLFAAEEPFPRNSVATDLFHDRLDRRLPCLSAAGQILYKHLVDDSDFESQA